MQRTWPYCVHDKAVAEAMLKVIKTEFVNDAHFEKQAQLDIELFDYVHWYNHIRIHGTLGYLSPVEYKSRNLKTAV